jgi:hypothetical protein
MTGIGVGGGIRGSSSVSTPKSLSIEEETTSSSLVLCLFFGFGCTPSTGLGRKPSFRQLRVNLLSSGTTTGTADLGALFFLCLTIGVVGTTKPSTGISTSVIYETLKPLFAGWASELTDKSTATSHDYLAKLKGEI